jgi:copper resistance protein C
VSGIRAAAAWRAAVAAITVALAPAAFAHAFLDHASPAVGSTVAKSPPEAAVWFSEPLEPAFSTLHVLDPGGKVVDRGAIKGGTGDRKAMRVSLPPLAPGTYTVKWRALSVDTHVTEGDFTFRVSP